ncbi:MAG: hypothetical protein JXX14_03285 [Deltaproteobacteria bacterium]|nr:hypothetical protein [Deltaproteobacteria bacterium]
MTDHTVLAKTIETQVSIPASLDDAATSLNLDFCDVNGFGNLKWAEILDSAGSQVHIEGPIDLLSIRGRVRHAGQVTVSDYRVLLAKHTDNGIQVVGGKLTGGVATLLELAFTPLMSAETVRNVAANTYLGKKAAEKNVKEQSWASAMNLSAALEKKGRNAQLWDNEPVKIPSVGDIVKHRQFGDCTVVKIDDEHVTIQKPDGRVVQLGLRILTFTPIDEDGGRTLWDASVKR